MEVWGGIECTINRVGDDYFDQFSYHNQYDSRNYLDDICSLGIRKLRYPILWEKQQPNQNEPICWAVEENLAYLRHKNVDIIAGLLHHGSGPKYTSLLDKDFPEKFAAYASAVAEKFPWINHYTPVNEPLTTARFCGMYGIWHPHEQNALSFLQILLNECKASILAMLAIRKVNPKAKFVLTEDLAHIHSTALLVEQASFENHRKWLSIDLLCGRVDEKHPLWDYLLDVGIETEQLHFFTANTMPPDVLGFNYYITSERFLDEELALYPPHTHGGNGRIVYADVEVVRTGKAALMGLKGLLKLAWERYHLPMAITEAHLHCGREDQLRWLKQTWEAASELCADGIKIEGVTFWSLLGAYGWNALLSTEGGSYEAGAFDMGSGVPRPTAISKFINSLSNRQIFQHPVCDLPGWWERPIRFSYPPQQGNPCDLAKGKVQPILIVGGSGALGQSFAQACQHRGICFQSLSRKELDLCNPAQLKNAIEKYRPWAIINAAGFSRIDDAELDFGACYQSNAIGPKLLAAECQKSGIKLLGFSSDLVFDGLKKDGYLENDLVNPINVYGWSQVKAEQHLMQKFPETLLIRSSNFFGNIKGANLLNSLMDALKSGRSFPMANDVFISPTYLPDLVDMSLDLLIDDENGIWHLANDSIISWYDFASQIADRGHFLQAKINGVSLEKMSLKAKRPLFSALKTTKGISFPSLEKALDNCFANLSA